jgi:hypothetical protein
VWKACFEVRQRPRQRLWSANTAMHLSRRSNVLFFAEKTLRPGDGERSKDQQDNILANTLVISFNHISIICEQTTRHLQFIGQSERGAKTLGMAQLTE